MEQMVLPYVDSGGHLHFIRDLNRTKGGVRENFLSLTIFKLGRWSSPAVRLGLIQSILLVLRPPDSD